MSSAEQNSEKLNASIHEMVVELLEDGFEAPAICIALASHAARLGLDSEADEMSVVGTLFLPIVHQLLETKQSNAGDETAFDESNSVTHTCPTLQ